MIDLNDIVDMDISGTQPKVTHCVWCESEFIEGTFHCSNNNCPDGNVKCAKCGTTFHMFNVACHKCGHIYGDAI